ncbi:sporulation protein YunB [Texcoconibacillus texcoconensis]|uniref:Sporulation protein YunB n=1 Tax=Texcoconibacillus texcoconensis TaxID=1095777 RepID=A0A840QQB7_9BACI|nr:sporulation protein YunB [Texcoconibacillus texcoconensis]MBB5173531.1 sporulation protein YunB [Texcoconibacillus texcoconensis]
MKRMKGIGPRKRKGPLPFRYVFLISFIIFCILTVQGLFIVEKGIRPTLIEIARTETQRIGTLAINDAISKKILENTDMEHLIEYQTDNSGEIVSVEFNSHIYNRVLQESTQRVQSYLNDIEHGRVRNIDVPEGVDIEMEGATFAEDGIIHMIPLGQATNNALLAHLGPRVPVRLSVIGDVQTNLNENIQHVGINNTYISISIDFEVDARVIIPFATDTAIIETTVPVGMVLVPGEVPEFFGGTDGISPAIMPSEDDEDEEEMGVQPEEETTGQLNEQVDPETFTEEYDIDVFEAEEVNPF